MCVSVAQVIEPRPSQHPLSRSSLHSLPMGSSPGHREPVTVSEEALTSTQGGEGEHNPRCAAAVHYVLPVATDAANDPTIAAASHPESSFPSLWEAHEDAAVLLGAQEDALNIGLMREAAEDGDPHAQLAYGELLLYGYPAGNLQPDVVEAERLMAAAAEAGIAQAQAQYALLIIDRIATAEEEEEEEQGGGGGAAEGGGANDDGTRRGAVSSANTDGGDGGDDDDDDEEEEEEDEADGERGVAGAAAAGRAVGRRGGWWAPAGDNGGAGAGGQAGLGVGGGAAAPLRADGAGAALHPDALPPGDGGGAAAFHPAADNPPHVDDAGGGAAAPFNGDGAGPLAGDANAHAVAAGGALEADGSGTSATKNRAGGARRSHPRAKGSSDLALARSYLDSAAEAGEASAFAGLGFLYQTGTGGFPKDITAALENLERAGGCGCPHRCLCLLMSNTIVILRCTLHFSQSSSTLLPVPVFAYTCTSHSSPRS